MHRIVMCGAAALIMTSSGLAVAQSQPPMGQQEQRSPTDQPQGSTATPQGTTPPTGAAQPQAPIADQAKPAAVGPAQGDTAATMPGTPVPGATPQTTPSTVSAANAQLDAKPTTALQFPLTDAQRAMIAASIAAGPQTAQATADLSAVKVAGFVPPATPLHDFSLDVMRDIPASKNYKYARADKRILIVDPANLTVVGEIMP